MPDQAEAVRMLRARVGSLPSDLKALFAIIDDADCSEELRTLAAAAVFYSLSPAGLIPAKEGALALADQAIVVRCALDEVRRGAPDRTKVHADADPDTWAGLEHEIELLGGLLGDVWPAVRDGWRAIGMQGLRGKTPKQVAADPEVSTWLYAMVDEAVALRDIDEQAIIREIHKEPLVAKLSARLSNRKRA
jgi:uncharacterized membrane protein YkvA (DUF1232 family)